MNKYQKALDKIFDKCADTFYIDNEIEELQELVDKATPTKPKFEATKINDETCPNCGNVCFTTETFGSNKIKITTNYCKYCGQALDWSE